MRKFSFPAIIFSVFTLLMVMILAVPQQVSAACVTKDAGLDLGSCLTLGVGGDAVSKFYSKPTDLINVVTTNIFIFAGFILLIMVMYAGFLFISQGPKGVEQAKNVLTTALIGFGLMFASYWILKIISIITGADILF